MSRLFPLVLLLGLSPCAHATVTLGVVQGLTEATSLAESLKGALGEDVKVRTFSGTAALCDWLTVYREVDLAIVSEGACSEATAIPLTDIAPQDMIATSQKFVARADLPRAVLTRWKDALSTFRLPPVEPGPVPMPEVKTPQPPAEKAEAFTILPLAPGIFAALPLAQGGAGSNALFMTGGDSTMIAAAGVEGAELELLADAAASTCGSTVQSMILLRPGYDLSLLPKGAEYILPWNGPNTSPGWAEDSKVTYFREGITLLRGKHTAVVTEIIPGHPLLYLPAEEILFAGDLTGEDLGQLPPLSQDFVRRLKPRVILPGRGFPFSPRWDEPSGQGFSSR